MNKKSFREKRKRVLRRKKLGFFYVSLLFLLPFFFYFSIFLVDHHPQPRRSLPPEFYSGDKESGFYYSKRFKYNYNRVFIQKTLEDRPSPEAEPAWNEVPETLYDASVDYFRRWSSLDKENGEHFDSFKNCCPEFYLTIRNINQRTFYRALDLYRKMDESESRQILKNEFTLQKSDPLYLVNLALFIGSYYRRRDKAFLMDLTYLGREHIASYYLSDALSRDYFKPPPPKESETGESAEDSVK